ncbi:MAG TPA: YaeQ family protein [Polyangiaceae bacterium]|nr:YaeQ family protein [Polyangiaceae bacterium]
MAAGASIHHVELLLSDVDRGVYESLSIHLARHPSESERFLATRLLAYALSYEEGIAFSKGGVSSADEPPIAIRDATGVLRAWIDVGSPSAERLHKAAKAAERVALYTCASVAYLSGERIHRREQIEVHRFDAALVDALAASLDRRTKLEIVRNEARLYITGPGGLLEGAVSRVALEL